MQSDQNGSGDRGSSGGDAQKAAAFVDGAVRSSSLKRQVESLLASIDQALDDDEATENAASTSRVGEFLLPPEPSQPSTREHTQSSASFVAAAQQSTARSPFSLGSGSPFGKSAASKSASPFGSSVTFGSSPVGRALAPFGLPAPPPSPAVAAAMAERDAAVDAVSAIAAAHASRAPPQQVPTVTLAELEKELCVGEQGMPPCRPHSREDFDNRVASFRMAINWLDKPADLSPLRCAQFGWFLDGPERLRCAVCAVTMRAPVAETMRAMPAVFTKWLADGHRPLCAWKDNPSPASFCSVLLPGPNGAPPSVAMGVSQLREALRTRFDSLLRLHALPALAQTLDDAMAQCAAVAGKQDADDLRASLLRLLWRGACGDTNASETSRRHVAATLALLGWQPTVAPCLERSNGVVKLAPRDALRCKEDARTLLLANYLPLDQATVRSGTFCTPHNAASNAASDANVAPRVTSHATSHAQAHAAAAASERVLATSPAAGATAKTTAHSASASASAAAPSARCDGALGASTPPAKRLRVQSAEDAEADAPTPLDPVAEHRPWSPWLAIVAGDSVPAWMRCAAILLDSTREHTAAAKPITPVALSAALALV